MTNAGNSVRPQEIEVRGLDELRLTDAQIAAAAGRRFAPGYLRAYVLERDGYRCHYCHAPVTDETANMDHVTPWPEGLTTPDNLVTACRICNHAKGNRKRRNLSKADKRLIRILNGLKANQPKGKPWTHGIS